MCAPVWYGFGPANTHQNRMIHNNRNKTIIPILSLDRIEHFSSQNPRRPTKSKRYSLSEHTECPSDIIRCSWLFRTDSTKCTIAPSCFPFRWFPLAPLAHSVCALFRSFASRFNFASADLLRRRKKRGKMQIPNKLKSN